MSENISAYEFPYYYVETNKINFNFRNPNHPEYKKFLNTNWRKEYPHEKNPGPGNKMTRAMLKLIRTSPTSGEKLSTDERGDFKTDSHEEVALLWMNIHSIPGVELRLHPMSKKLPDGMLEELQKNFPVGKPATISLSALSA